MGAIYRKELRSFFNNMTGYIFIAFILLVTGIFTMAVNFRQGYPYFEYALSSVSFIFLLVGFRNVPTTLVECAKLDGANYLQNFIHVYVPIASPQIFYVVFLNIIASFKAFGAINVLTSGGPSESTNILIYALYSNAFNRGRFETACVYAVVLCTLIFLVTRIQMILEKRMVHYQ